MLPPVHLSRGGEPASDVLRIIAGNSRTPDKAIGDIHALIAGANTIGRRIEEMIEQHGADVLARFIQDWIDTTERRMRDELARIPGGTYHGSFTIEGDGFEAGKRFHVDAAVTAADGEIEIDFTGTSNQSGGAINASFSQTMSGVIYAVRCLVDPEHPDERGLLPRRAHGAAAGNAREPVRARGVWWAHHQRHRGRSRRSSARWRRRSPTTRSQRAR